MKISPLEAELFHADGQTDKHDEANSRLSHFYESAYKSLPPPEIECWSPIP
jgi:hypothetical protein